MKTQKDNGKRLQALGAQDYTISLDKENGTVRVELAENDNVDMYIYYLYASQKITIKTQILKIYF